MASLDNPIDSIAFGVNRSKIENILFASSNDGNLLAIDGVMSALIRLVMMPAHR
jgi:hypothetical protein